MRIVFPTDENEGYLSKRGAHFGKAKYYTVIVLKDGNIVDVQSAENKGHKSGGCEDAILNILSLDPDALIVGGIGANPARGFMKAGLNVYFDQESKTVQESISLFVENKLQMITTGTCNHN